MASFVMHYVALEKLIDSMNNYKLVSDDKNNFRLGNLIVDTLGIDNYDRDEKLSRKMITHFRDEEDDDKCIQIPNIDKFMNKYEYLVNRDYSAMGYLFHLYTDKMFFEYLYEEVINPLDKDMQVTNYKKDNYYVRVLHNNKIFKTSDFYSGSDIGGLYRDYSNMNKYLINKYSIVFNYEELKCFSYRFINPGIEEIDYKYIGEVFNKMKDVIDNSYSSDVNELNIFNIDDIDKFISLVVDGFNNKYEANIKKLVKVKKR